MPNEIRLEPDLIPLDLLPKENLTINLVYRGEEIKKDDTFLVFLKNFNFITLFYLDLQNNQWEHKCTRPSNPLFLRSCEMPFRVFSEKNRASCAANR